MSAILNQLRQRAGRIPTDAEETRAVQLKELQEDHAAYTAKMELGDRLMAQQAKATEAFHLNRPDAVKATDKQVGFIHALLAKLEGTTVYATAKPWCDQAIAAGLTRDRASDVITRLKGYVANAPVVTTPPRAFDAYDDIPDGYYAVSNNDGDASFYRVRRHNGRLFIDLQVSDSFNRIPWVTRKAALDKIRHDTPQAAGERYARELGRCYRCGRTLTDETSRELGIGPTCRNK